MNSTFSAIIAISAFAATEVAAEGCRQMVCNNNPVCQQARNAGNCAAARAAGGTMPVPGGSGRTGGECQRQAGFTQAQWAAGQTTAAQRRAWDRCMGR